MCQKLSVLPLERKNMLAKLGLKASADPKQLESRLQYHPEVFEFYTSQADFNSQGLERLEEAIFQVKDQSTDKIVLHHPMTFDGEFLEMVTPEKLFPQITHFLEKSTNDLLQLAFDHDCQVLVHGSYELRNKSIMDYYGNWEKANQELFLRLDYFAKLGQDHIMFENSISPLFYFGDPTYDQLIYQKGYRLAFDISHSFIKMKGSNSKLMASLETLKDHIVHYHLVDSMGEIHDSLPLGQGKIDWSGVLDHINPEATAIYEIDLKDMNNPLEQLQSHQYLMQVEKTKQNSF